VETVVEVDQLTKAYGSFMAVDRVTMSVGTGEIVALLGPNGAGKTTTIRMLMGILHPTSGHARIAGYDCFRERPDVMRHVGYLPDEPAFYDYLKGTEIVEFVAAMNGLDSVTARSRANDLVDRLELGDAMADYAVNFSKGMKKKLALVCALLHEPSVLILDEPTNGLDPFATRTLHAMIREAAHLGTALFYSTHLLDQAERLCDRAGILHQGRLAACGPLEQLRDTLAPGGSVGDRSGE